VLPPHLGYQPERKLVTHDWLWAVGAHPLSWTSFGAQFSQVCGFLGGCCVFWGACVRATEYRGIQIGLTLSLNANQHPHHQKKTPTHQKK
jgi:hypothetical protein